MTETFTLPQPIGTDYEYLMASRHGRIVMIAGQLAKTGHNKLYATGRVGEEVDLNAAMHSAEIAATQVLSWLKEQTKPGESIGRILRMTAYIAVGDDFIDISTIADAASRTFISALGERGRHPRSVLGVSRLPRNAPVLLEVTAAMTSAGHVRGK